MRKVFGKSILPTTGAAIVVAAILFVAYAPEAEACGLLNRRIALSHATGATDPHDQIVIMVTQMMGSSTAGPIPNPFSRTNSPFGPPNSIFGPNTSVMGPATSVMGPATSVIGPPTSIFGPPDSAFGSGRSDSRNPSSNPQDMMSAWEKTDSIKEAEADLRRDMDDIFNRSAFDPPARQQRDSFGVSDFNLPQDFIDQYTLPDDYVIPPSGVDTRRIHDPDAGTIPMGPGLGLGDIVGVVEHGSKILKVFQDDPTAEKVLETIGGKAEGLGNLITNFNRAANLTSAGTAMDENAFAEAINNLVRDEVKGVAGKAGAATGKYAGGLIGLKYAGIGAIPGAVVGGVAGKYAAEYTASQAYDATTADYVKEQARQYFRDNVKEGHSLLDQVTGRDPAAPPAPYRPSFPVQGPQTPYPLHR